ncbi:MAG TPA: DNA-binding protein [Nitrosopumilaceae archaeon]|nr:DNA-binding protein [Nitrosopumilaceae archaeon]
MSEIKEGETQLVGKPSFSNEEKVFVIREEPVMECALDVLMDLGNSGQITLVAKGNAIPTAVAVANVVTENMMKGNSKIVDISVDSENGSGKYGMTLISTIKIIIAKTN